MVLIRLRHPGTRRAESDEDHPDVLRGAAREAPMAAHDADRGAPATGLPDDALRRGALSPTPSGSPPQSFPRSARVAPTLSSGEGTQAGLSAAQEKDSSAHGVRAVDSNIRKPPTKPFRIRFRLPTACCSAREPDHAPNRGTEALPLTSSDPLAPSLPRRAPFAPPASAPLIREEMAKAEFDEQLLMEKEAASRCSATQTCDGLARELKVAEMDAKKCCLCAVEFNLFKRPHSCRSCGETFCKKCTKGRLALTDADDAPLVRVCDKCLVAKEAAKKCPSCDVVFSLSKRPHCCRKCRGTFCRKCSHKKIALSIDDNAPVVRVCDKCFAEFDEQLLMEKEAASRCSATQTCDGLARELKVAPEIELSPVPFMTNVAVNTRRYGQAKTSVSRLDDNVTKASDRRVALIYDACMLAHRPQRGSSFLGIPERLEWIMKKLNSEGISNRCEIFEPDLAKTKSLLAVHSIKHIKDVQALSSKSQMELDEIAMEYDPYGDTYYCQESTKAAQSAAGSVIKACDLVASGKFSSSFALVRPPGHHVGRDGPPAGFCLLNNVAVGAAHLLNYYQMEKILIVDWDVHHGDGTQDIFFDNKKVLFFSVHRFDGKFFPFTDSGSLDFIGAGDGIGHNINVCFKHPKIRDADYIVVWDHLLLPLIQEFEPEIIIISAGFDSAEGDPLGSCDATPAGFASLLEKTVLRHVLKFFLGEKPGNINKRCLPYDTTWKMIKETREKFKLFWKVYAEEIPEAMSSKTKQYRKR